MTDYEDKMREKRQELDSIRFYDRLPDELLEWATVGFQDFAELLEDPAHEKDDMESCIKHFYFDQNQLCVVDEANQLHMFRIRLERL